MLFLETDRDWSCPESEVCLVLLVSGVDLFVVYLHHLHFLLSCPTQCSLLAVAWMVHRSFCVPALACPYANKGYRHFG